MYWDMAVPSYSAEFTSWHVTRVCFKMFVSLLFSEKSVGLSQPSQMWIYLRHMPAYWDFFSVAKIRPKAICSYVWFHFWVWSKLREGGGMGTVLVKSWGRGGLLGLCFCRWLAAAELHLWSFHIRKIQNQKSSCLSNTFLTKKLVFHSRSNF